MKKGIIAAIGGVALLAGCGTTGDKPSAPAAPKVVKPPYQIEFGAKADKPNPAGISLPAVKYTANSAGQERRASLIVRFDSSAAKGGESARNQMIMGPVDLSDSGTLPNGYMESADKGLATMLAAACVKGTVNVKVALVRSSIKPDAGDGEINGKRLSDWTSTDLVFKNPHPKC